MDLKDLRYFLHLSGSLHFARSSRELHISPSGLTRSIQRLEQELDVALFERDNRTVTLTQAGLLLRDYSRQTLDELSRLKTSIQEQSGDLRGKLSLFCSVTASYSFLHDLLDRFRQSHPNIELQLHTGDSAEALQRVSDELDDVVIAALPPKLSDKLVFLPLARSELVCIGPVAASPVQQMIKQAGADGDIDWKRLPVVMPETGLTRARVEEWFARKQIKPLIYAQVSGHEAMVSMASLGCGIAIVPKVVLDNSPMRDKLQILPLMTELKPFVIGLCAIRRKLSNPLISAFWSVAESGSSSQEQSDYRPGAPRV
ncbi:MAG: HTH-type transcriptional activator IlvY [Pseudohongiella sp.]|nr:HTH-type transcriptional activator IlvY [Pseudohongiella sp.]MDO9521760.1 HTH-type transcriptional activator IlvY [Pseudohongiella sp.]MDP2128302.1 HTH-type transcriptional activator IlvY [Pseudohongiella sp.]